MKASTPVTERHFVVPLAVVTSLFFIWAIGVNLNDILIQHLKKRFGLSDFAVWGYRPAADASSSRDLAIPLIEVE